MATPTALSIRPVAAPTFPRLVASEFRRFTARRFTRVLLGLAVVGYLVAVAFVWQSHSRVTPADMAQATVQRDQQIDQIRQSVADCLKQGQSVEACGTVPTAEEFPIDQFLANTPFRPDDVSTYTLAVGASTALAGFLLAATFVGAEWSSRNIVALLFYEPRRVRVLGAKLLVTCGALVVLAAVAQVIWAVTAHLLLHYRGIAVSTLGADADHFWSDTTGSQLRAVLEVLPLAILGFALANLLRSTAAAIGVAFVYLAVLESVFRAIDPGLQPYLFTTSVTAWVSTGGIEVFGRQAFDVKLGYVSPEVIHISSAQGGVTMVAYAVVALVASVLVFLRRDIT